MICHNEYISEEAAEYLNSRPAFIDSCGCIMNPGFFNKYFHPELMSGNHEPVLDRYHDGVCCRKGSIWPAPRLSWRGWTRNGRNTGVSTDPNFLRKAI